MALREDVRYSLRSLRKSPGFAVSTILVLMLGIGANSAIFSIVNAVLLRPLPFPDSDAVVMVFQTPPAKAFPGIDRFAVSPANFLDWRSGSDVFETMAMYRGRAYRRTVKSDRPEPVQATVAESTFFDVLKTQAAAGRLFRPEECEPGRDDVVVLSDYYAREQFGSPAAAVGQTLHLNDRPYRIIGVLSPEARVRSWSAADRPVFLPLTWTPEDRTERKNHTYGVVARLKSGVGWRRRRRR